MTRSVLLVGLSPGGRLKEGMMFVDRESLVLAMGVTVAGSTVMFCHLSPLNMLCCTALDLSR